VTIGWHNAFPKRITSISLIIYYQYSLRFLQLAPFAPTGVLLSLGGVGIFLVIEPVAELIHATLFRRAMLNLTATKNQSRILAQLKTSCPRQSKFRHIHDG
jgi:hypothetical protein